MGRRIPVLSILLVLFISSCIPSVSSPTPPGPTVTYNPFATLSPTPFGPSDSTPTLPPLSTSIFVPPTPTVTASPGMRPRYNLQAMLNYASRALSVDETILYQNSTGAALDRLVLAVEPNRWKDCFGLKTLSGRRVSGYSLDGSRLEVRLDPPLAPGESVELSLHFDLSLPPAGHFQLFGYKAGQINLVDWFPFIVPYRGGWLLHPPGEAGEHLVYEAADFDVTITPTGAVTDLTMAAGAPVAQNNFRLEAARTAAVSISDRLLQSRQTVNGVTVTSYFFSDEIVQGERVLTEAARALETYTLLFGPYPYSSLSIVETDFYDGMEYDGLFFLGRDFYRADDGTPLNYLIALTVHETAHQWWFGRVGSDQALEPWLDEALSTYSEYLFYEQNYPGVAAAWWTFRVDAFSPAGFVDTTIYDADDFQTYANAAYLRGAQFLRDLRARIGDEAFFAFLKDYSARMAGEIATAEDFFRILALHSGADISDLRRGFQQR